MLTFYRAAWSTNCERVALGFALKGIGEDEVEAIVIDYSDRSAVEAASGQGLVPVLADPAADATVWDSVAILRHLERTRPDPALWPADPAGAAEVDLFVEWFERVWKVAPNAIEDELEREEPDRERVDALAAQMGAHLGLFERLHSGRDHLLGSDLTAADLVAYPFLRYAAGRDPADDELFHRVLDDHQGTQGRPALAAWIERMDAMPRTYGSPAPPGAREPAPSPG